MIAWKRSTFFVMLALGLCTLPAIARSAEESTKQIRVGLGVGGVYEFYLLDGSLFSGGGTTAELSLELELSKKSALGIGTRYRTLAALGPDPRAVSVAVIKVNNLDYFGYLRLGWLDLLGGATQFSSKLILANGSGQEIVENSLIPLVGAGISFLPTKRLKGRLYGIYTFGQAFGYSMSSVQFLATFSIALP
jgi:hypothetical protein